MYNEIDKKWNYKTANKIEKWLTKHITNHHRIETNIGAGVGELRVYDTDSGKLTPVVVVGVYDVIDLVVDTFSVNANKRCYCYAEVRDYLAEWTEKEFEINQTNSKKGTNNNG